MGWILGKRLCGVFLGLCCVSIPVLRCCLGVWAGWFYWVGLIRGVFWGCEMVCDGFFGGCKGVLWVFG